MHNRVYTSRPETPPSASREMMPRNSVRPSRASTRGSRWLQPRMPRPARLPRVLGRRHEGKKSKAPIEGDTSLCFPSAPESSHLLGTFELFFRPARGAYLLPRWRGRLCGLQLRLRAGKSLVSALCPPMLTLNLSSSLNAMNVHRSSTDTAIK